MKSLVSEIIITPQNTTIIYKMIKNNDQTNYREDIKNLSSSVYKANNFSETYKNNIVCKDKPNGEFKINAELVYRIEKDKYNESLDDFFNVESTYVFWNHLSIDPENILRGCQLSNDVAIDIFLNYNMSELVKYTGVPG